MGAGTGSLRSAFMKDKNSQAAAPSPEHTPTPAPTPPVEHYKGSTKDVARVVAHDLGLGADLPSGESKADTIQRALAAIKSGAVTPEQIATVTQKAKGLHPETFLTDRLLKSTRRLPGIAGAIGLGAAAAAGMPGEAEASTSREPSVQKQQPETSSGPSEDEREYGTGLPKGAAREVLKSAAGTALTGAPVVGEALMAAEAPNLYKPSDEDLADAEYWQRGREEMAKPHEASGGAVNPEHLPEHERGFLDNPDEAHERSKWLIPYLRAGSESVKRGGDFFGGDERYEQELQALKHFYHGRQQAPVAPESDTAPEAPAFAKGGAVNRKSNPHLKQMNSIRDTFKLKLQDKERLISSLEKAVARKPNAKLSKRLSKEKSEAQRIHEHLQKIMAHAQ